MNSLPVRAVRQARASAKEQDEGPLIALAEVARVHRLDFMELGGGAESSLGMEVENAGGLFNSLGLHNSFDFAKRSSVENAKLEIQRLRPRWVHARPP